MTAKDTGASPDPAAVECSPDIPLVEAATEARSLAYAPYSGFSVGAAVRLSSGEVFTGVNVENASYGLGVCAERHAVAAAVRGGMRPGTLAAVAVVGDSPGQFSPCGACRQVIGEFAAPDIPIYLHNLRDGITRKATTATLLPMAFGKDSLSS